MILPGRDLIPVIRTALERGQRVRLKAEGMSMMPFILNGDIVELEPTQILFLGDIVLAEISVGRYVLHRIVCMKDDYIWLRGDNQTLTMGPITQQEVFGRAVTIFRNGQVHSLDKELWRFAGLVWVMIIPLGFFLVQFILLIQNPRHIRWWLMQDPRHLKYWWQQLISNKPGVRPL